MIRSLSLQLAKRLNCSTWVAADGRQQTSTEVEKSSVRQMVECMSRVSAAKIQVKLGNPDRIYCRRLSLKRTSFPNRCPCQWPSHLFPLKRTGTSSKLYLSVLQQLWQDSFKNRAMSSKNWGKATSRRTSLWFWGALKTKVTTERYKNLVRKFIRNLLVRIYNFFFLYYLFKYWLPYYLFKYGFHFNHTISPEDQLNQALISE
jgi:hypothetical protein